MAMHDLAPEILVHIFESLSSVSDIISLSLTCRYFHSLLPKSKQLVLFFRAVDEASGPVEDIIQLLTQNQSQTLHIQRSPPLSFALLSQVTAVARVAQRFVSLYPGFRWLGGESVNRRLLDSWEARRLRRAVYRLWSYTKAFHQSPFPFSFRVTPRLDKDAVTERLQLLRTWSTEELFELEDLRCVLEQLLASEICPTDGEVYSRIPNDAQTSFRRLPVHYPHGRPLIQSSQAYDDLFHTSRPQEVSDNNANNNKPRVQELRARHMQGWGSDLQTFYLLQSFLKFSPAQILWLFDNAVSRADVDLFIEQQTHDTCFFESGSFLFHDWVTVLHARGVNIQQAREDIWNSKAGIVVESMA